MVSMWWVDLSTLPSGFGMWRRATAFTRWQATSLSPVEWNSRTIYSCLGMPILQSKSGTLKQDNVYRHCKVSLNYLHVNQTACGNYTADSHTKKPQAQTTYNLNIFLMTAVWSFSELEEQNLFNLVYSNHLPVTKGRWSGLIAICYGYISLIGHRNM